MNDIAEHHPSTDPSLAVRELAGLRILIVHHWIYTWAGAERCLEQFVRLMPHADVVAGIVTPRMRGTLPIPTRPRETWVGRLPGARTHHRWFLPAHAVAFATLDTRPYDLIISISHAFEKAVRVRKPGGVHLCYCLTPPRYVWDLAEAHGALATPVQRAVLRIGRTPLRAADRRFARGVDRFVSISHHVAARVRSAYGVESPVVYPPVDIPPRRPVARDSFLLSLGRLVPYKRVDLAIRAAESLRIPLVIAGDGPARPALEAIAGPQTVFRGTVTDAEAAHLLATCAAFVFCGEEDFGIAPLEANAHGAPVIAFGRGGVAETMEQNVSGVLFHEQHPDAVAAAVTEALARDWDRDALRRHARRFAPDRFRREIGAELLRVLP